MKISIIAALTKEKVIGKNNKLPWHISEELQHFKKMTLGKPVVMGRKTFESLNCKPLPKRKNIILTKHKDKIISEHNLADLKNVVFVDSVDKVLQVAKAVKAENTQNENLQKDNKELMVIGGSSIYKAFLPIVDRMYLSIIKDNCEGDAYFPDYESEYNWKLIAQEEHDKFKVIILQKEKG